MPEMKRYLVKQTKAMEVTAESHGAAVAYARAVFNKEYVPKDIRKKVWGSSQETVSHVSSEVIN